MSAGTMATKSVKVICVVGAGTGVGKTFVGAGLVAVAAARGLPCRGLKPIESGVGAVAEDAMRLGEAAGVTVAPRYGFPAAVSPHRAARQEGVAISLDEVARWVSEHARGWTVVETAGGLLSPLDERGGTNLDLCARLQPDAIVAVARDELGALHQTAAVMLALRTRGLGERTVAVLDRMDEAAGHLENELEVARLAITPQVCSVGPAGPFERLFDRVVKMVDAGQPVHGRR